MLKLSSYAGCDHGFFLYQVVYHIPTRAYLRLKGNRNSSVPRIVPPDKDTSYIFPIFCRMVYFELVFVSHPIRRDDLDQMWLSTNIGSSQLKLTRQTRFSAANIHTINSSVALAHERAESLYEPSRFCAVRGPPQFSSLYIYSTPTPTVLEFCTHQITCALIFLVPWTTFTIHSFILGIRTFFIFNQSFPNF